MSDCQHTHITIEWYEITTDAFECVDGMILASWPNTYEPQFHAFSLTCADCRWKRTYPYQGWRESIPSAFHPLIQKIIDFDDTVEEK